MQFYFISVVSILLCGVTLSYDYLSTRFSFLILFNDSLREKKYQIFLGVTTAVVGFLKFFIHTDSSSILILGDFLPSTAGILAGFSVAVIGLRQQKEPADDGTSDHKKTSKTRITREGSAPIIKGEMVVSKIATFFIQNKVSMGIASISISILHFLFPSSVIL